MRGSHLIGVFSPQSSTRPRLLCCFPGTGRSDILTLILTLTLSLQGAEGAQMWGSDLWVLTSGHMPHPKLGNCPEVSGWLGPFRGLPSPFLCFGEI